MYPGSPGVSSRCESGRSSRSNALSTFHCMLQRRIDPRGHQAHRSRRCSRRVRGRRTPARSRSSERLEDRPRQRFVPRCQTARFRSPRTRKPHDLVAVEQLVHARLSGTLVPQLYAADSDHDLVFFEWCGDQTLDDVCQEGAAGTYGRLAVEGFCRIQSVFHEHCDVFAPRTFPGCTRRICAAPGAKPPDVLRGASRSLPNSSRRSRAASVRLRLQILCPGSCDSSNGLAAARADRLSRPQHRHRSGRANPRFIEFSKIGWTGPNAG